MRQIIAGFASSLDGYIAGPNNEFDWILIDKDIDFAAWNQRFDTFLYGRKTFEISFPPGAKISTKYKHYVFSRSLQEVPEGVQLVNGNMEQMVQQLKQETGKDIAVFGGAHLLTSLLNLQLVDELHVSIIPVLLAVAFPWCRPSNRAPCCSLPAPKPTAMVPFS